MTTTHYKVDEDVQIEVFNYINSLSETKFEFFNFVRTDQSESEDRVYLEIYAQGNIFDFLNKVDDLGFYIRETMGPRPMVYFDITFPNDVIKYVCAIELRINLFYDKWWQVKPVAPAMSVAELIKGITTSNRVPGRTLDGTIPGKSK